MEVVLRLLYIQSYNHYICDFEMRVRVNEMLTIVILDCAVVKAFSDLIRYSRTNSS